MWLLDTGNFMEAVKALLPVEKNEFCGTGQRVLRLLAGDEEFLKQQTLESIANIFNYDAPEVLEYFLSSDCYAFTEDFLGLESVSYRSRRRII